MNKLTRENYIGFILGGPIGDALGAPIEFSDVNDIFLKFGKDGLRHYHESGHKIGLITDDTQMLLFTAEGLIRDKLFKIAFDI